MEVALNESQEQKISSSLKFQIGIAFFAFILIGLNDGAVGVLLPSLREYYKVDKATVSLLFLASTFGYLIAAFSTGYLAEKLGQRRHLIAGPSIFLIGTLLVSFMPPFPVLAFSLLLVGFGIAIIDAGLNAYIVNLPRSTVFLNYLHAFYGIGALLGPIIASTIIAVQLGWNVTYMIWAVLGFIIIFSFVKIFKISAQSVNQSTTSKAENSESDDTTTANSQPTTRNSIYKLRAVWYGAFFLMFYVGAEVSLGSWSYTFLTEERKEAALFSGWAVSGYWFGLTMGRFLLGKVGEKFGNKRLIQGCLAGVLLGVFLIWFVPFGAVSAAGLWVVGFSFGPIFPTTIALMPSLVTSRLLPGAIGFLVSLGSMGAAFFPWLAGNLAQNMGLWTLMPYVVVLNFGMLFFWLTLQAEAKKQSA